MKILHEKCKKCLICVGVCPMNAISQVNGEVVIDKEICICCGCCAASCPNKAIDYDE